MRKKKSTLTSGEGKGAKPMALRRKGEFATSENLRGKEGLSRGVQERKKKKGRDDVDLAYKRQRADDREKKKKKGDAVRCEGRGTERNGKGKKATSPDRGKKGKKEKGFSSSSGPPVEKDLLLYLWWEEREKRRGNS